MLPQPSIKLLSQTLQECRTQACALYLNSQICRNGLEVHHWLGDYFVSMLAMSGLMYPAQDAFYNLKNKSQFCLTSIINGYIQCNKPRDALNFYQNVQNNFPSPNGYVCLSLLKVCAELKDKVVGQKIHSEVSQNGLLRKDPFIGSALVDMHAKCGSILQAQEVFDMLPVRDVVTWTALIGGYSDHGRGVEALNCFEQMQRDGVFPNAVTYACCLKACASIGAIKKGKEIHDIVERKGFLQTSSIVRNTLVDMYAKCGLLEKAQEVFDNLGSCDVVTWTALIGGYAQHGQSEEALIYFEQMKEKGISPNALTISCILKAFGNLGAIDKAKDIYKYIINEGLLKTNQYIGNALIDMYSKCGMLDKAQQIFDELPAHDLVSWNALVTGYALIGNVDIVTDIFNEMRADGIRPDLVTFVSVLNACSHAGLIELGEVCYKIMCNEYAVVPTLEHHTCMVDLLGRAGQLDKAVATMKETLYHPNIVLWLTVLAGCRKWGNVELGIHAFEEVLKLDDKEESAYVCMYNIYADADMQHEAQLVDQMRTHKKIKRLIIE